MICIVIEVLNSRITTWDVFQLRYSFAGVLRYSDEIKILLAVQIAFIVEDVAGYIKVNLIRAFCEKQNEVTFVKNTVACTADKNGVLGQVDWTWFAVPLGEHSSSLSINPDFSRV